MAVIGCAAVHQRTALGVAVLDRATSEVTLGIRGAEPFSIASLAELVVAVDVQDRRRLEGLAVDDEDRDLIRRALGPSDEDAMNALWGRFDGEGADARVSSRADLQHTSAPDDPSQRGEMAMPAADGSTSATGWRAGVGDLGRPDVVAKQGWMCCFGPRFSLQRRPGGWTTGSWWP